MEHTQVEKTIQLNDGAKMPLLGLGTWRGLLQCPQTSLQGAVEAAIAAGYRHIDTAFCYKNEDIGKALQAKMQQGIIRRQDMFIVSKLYGTYHAPEDIPLCLNKSLSDLQLDYLDLYLVHFPVGLQKVEDELFPKNKEGQILTSDIDYVDVWRGMEALHASGKVKSIGVSNFSILQLERLLALCRVPPAVNQVELHPYLVQQEMIDFCKSKNIALTAYSPFGSPGRPPELIKEDKDPLNLLTDPVVTDIAKRHRRSPAQVLLRYHTQQGIIVIPKSDKAHHILENTKIFDFSLTEDDMVSLKGLDRGWRCCELDEVKSHPYYPFV